MIVTYVSGVVLKGENLYGWITRPEATLSYDGLGLMKIEEPVLSEVSPLSP